MPQPHTANICLLGDYSEDVLAHLAISRCLDLAKNSADFPGQINAVWCHTASIGSVADFEDYDGIWCVPASPYANTGGVLAVLEMVRTRRIPFLGTCGGYQHALIEYAQQVLGIEKADHAELIPEAESPLIAPLACALVEASEPLRVQPGSQLHQFYGCEEIVEQYHCSFGLNDSYRSLFEGGPLTFSVLNSTNAPRAFELGDHPFFIGTAYQPERAALDDRLHPLVAAFFHAAIRHKSAGKNAE